MRCFLYIFKILIFQGSKKSRWCEISIRSIKKCSRSSGIISSDKHFNYLLPRTWPIDEQNRCDEILIEYEKTKRCVVWASWPLEWLCILLKIKALLHSSWKGLQKGASITLFDAKCFPRIKRSGKVLSCLARRPQGVDRRKSNPNMIFKTDSCLVD